MVSGLYGQKIRMTASRVDKYSSCRFSYFLQFGLGAHPRKKAQLDAPEIGTFLHFVLENVARSVRQQGGFRQVADTALEAMTLQYVETYGESRLGGLSGKSSRFRYLFSRLAKKACAIVLDMAAELRRSDFVPLDFELRFAPGGDLPPVSATAAGLQMQVSGTVDRVDGYMHDGKLYLRVVDYKTGKKSFDLSDVWYGTGMQMLMYLFMLEDAGPARYGAPVVPAGVLYAPARDALLPSPRGASPESIRAQRAKALRRSGLILGDGEILEAMENGRTPEYLPIKFTKDGSPAGSLATAEQFGLLRRHIEKTLLQIAQELRSGCIPADPRVDGGHSACEFCDYAAACHFDELRGDSARCLTHLREAEVWENIRKEAET